MEQDRQTPTPFYSRPNRQLNGEPLQYAPRQTEESANGLARASMVLGIVAVISFFTFTLYGATMFMLNLRPRAAHSERSLHYGKG